MRKIYILGSINMDIVSRVPSHPAPGETIESADFQYLPGGKGSNQAIAAHRLGATVSLIGMIGQDAFGKELQSFYSNEGIDTHLVNVTEDSPTGAAFVAVDEAGENLIYVSPGANVHLIGEHVADVAFSKDDLVSSTLESPVDAIQHVFERAKECGATTVLNAAPANKVGERLFPHTDFLIVNEHELAQFAKTEESDLQDMLKELSDAHDLDVIVTLGADGVSAYIQKEHFEVKGNEVKVVDTTGAGDCFTGAFIVAVAENKDFDAALKFANNAAAVSVQKLGAALAMPYRNELT